MEVIMIDPRLEQIEQLIKERNQLKAEISELQSKFSDKTLDVLEAIFIYFRSK
jgi:cell division protein FtsB